MAAPKKKQSPREDLVPIAFHPPRRMLVWVVPCLLVCVAALAAAVLYRGYGRYMLFGLGIIGTLYFGRLASLLLKGSVRVDHDGVVHRLHGAERQTKWKQVRGLEIVTTPFGRRVMLRMSSGGTTLPLAAPREGLLGRGADLDAEIAEIVRRKTSGNRLKPTRRHGVGKVGLVVWPVVGLLAVQLIELPWQEPWWPTNKDAAALPRACQAAEPATVQQMVPGAVRSDEAHRDEEPFQSSGCRWAQPGGAAALDLSLHRYSSDGMSGGVAGAKDRMTTYSRAIGSNSVSGLADDAWQITRPTEYAPGDGRPPARNIQLAARERNVVVIVGYTVRDRTEQQMEDQAVVAARAALSRVRFG
ncbi:hypothetical protein ACQEU3_24415 [Spirillospora sp. CA-253888]